MPCTCRAFSLFLGSLNLFLKSCWFSEKFLLLGSHTPEAHSGVSTIFPQKDLLLHEIPSSTRKTGVEKVMAKEICQKYLEKRAGVLPEDCAEALAMAVCLCLRRRNASLAEVSLILSLSPAMSSVLDQLGLTSEAAWVCFIRD